MRRPALLASLFFGGLSFALSACSINFGEDYDEEKHFRFTEILKQTFQFSELTNLELENSVGEVVIEGWSENRVEIHAVKKAKTLNELHNANILFVESPTSLKIRSLHSGLFETDWYIDYTIRMPFGADLSVDHGVGELQITGIQGNVVVSMGVGDARLGAIESPEIRVDLGVGSLELNDVRSQIIRADVGTGELSLRLRPDASYVITAEVGLGELTISGFEKMAIQSEGFIGHRARGTLGSGEGTMSLDVGIGDLSVRPLRDK